MARPIIHLVADYGPYGDLAWSEVEGVLYREGPKGLRVIPTVVPKFNVTTASFAAYQLALRVPTSAAAWTIVFVNVDARTHTRARITNGDGEPFFIGVLRNGVRIVGPGLATFVVVQHFDALFSFGKINVASGNGGSPGQFRSRDLFAPIVATMAHKKDVPIEAISRETIPALLACGLLVEGYGNIKTSLLRKDVPGEHVTIALNGIVETVRVAKGLFDLKPGELGIYPGSSGEEKNPFLEIAVRFDPDGEDREDSAARRFGYPDARMQLFVTIQENVEVPAGS